MSARKGVRIYQKRGRYYGDFRSHADAGGRQEALCTAGSRRATADEQEAGRIAIAREKELDSLRRNGITPQEGLDLRRLGDFVDLELTQFGWTPHL